jgi:hypothetical protein
MPSLTMRGRYLLREYWSDSDLFLRLTAQQREVYIGLWTLADDEGWMPRDVPAIAAALFRYENRQPREKLVRDSLDRLRDLKKVVSHRCGCLFLPSVARYPRAGKKTSEHLASHMSHSKRPKAFKSHSNALPDPTLPYPTLPDVPRPRARGNGSAAADESDFRKRVPRAAALGDEQ